MHFWQVLIKMDSINKKQGGKKTKLQAEVEKLSPRHVIRSLESAQGDCLFPLFRENMYYLSQR